MKRQIVTPHKILLLILVSFVALASVYSVVVPLFEAPDETAHVDFVRFLRTELELPRQGDCGEAHQPPLYYALAAIASLPARLDNLDMIWRHNPNFVWAGRGQDINAVYHTAHEIFPWRDAVLAIHLMRAVSVLMGAITVLVVYLVAREVYPYHFLVPLTAAALVAFNPQFLFISSVVNNDNLANVCAAVVVWMMVRLLVGHVNWWTLIGLGLSLGIGLTAKQNILALVPAAILVLVYVSIQRHSFRLLLKGVLTVGGSIVIIAGWWYGRNQILYGDVFGLDAFLAHRPYENRALITSWELGRAFLDKMHRSFWGMFGWMNVPLPTWYYQSLLGLYVLVIVGGGLAWWKNHRKSQQQWAIWALLGSLPILYIAWVVMYGYRFGGSGWQGRYLFPTLTAIGLLLAVGLGHLLSGRGRIAPPLLIISAMLAVAVWALPSVIAPAYSYVTKPLSELENVQHPASANFGNIIRLAGYDLTVASSATGPQVVITLYWLVTDQPTQDYKVFVHLVDPDWVLYGQGDGYPLDGQFPTQAWRAGDLIIDPHTVYFDKPVPPGRYKIGVGWYLESTGERLPIVQNGQEVGTVAETEQFSLQP
ncbi:MAG TPA: DUF2142 domain-containing protein [Anaerolineae bacterium]|nr:DUF2142 domain-containing protein [Anaerolineae bacterium]